MAYEKAVRRDTTAGIASAIFGGIPALEGLSEDTLARVRARQVYAITRLTVPMMLANIINAIALVFTMQVNGQNSPAVMIWAGIAIAFAVFTIFVLYRRRAQPFPEKLSLRTARRVVANAALLGAIWAIPGAFFLPLATGSAMAFLVALAAGMIAGGAMALYPLPAAAMAYSGIIAVINFAGFLTTGDPTVLGFGLVTIAFYFVVTSTVARHSDVFVSEFVGRLELDEKNALIGRLLEEVRTRANDERIKSERRLAQAQKMEAIGQLTGGIAHDFNNLLAAIQGHAELIELEGNADESLTTPILRSTQRGSELVRGLLSIARKQPLNNQSIDVGNMIHMMAPLLSRTLGGRIMIRQHVPPDLWPAYADMALLESAVLNLALNARDAMPDGGTLTLSCANADSRCCAMLGRIEGASGQFVRVTVTDTGHGMSATVRDRALEPFFTTKKVGDGSGLGLSTVEGFCAQSGGHLWLESQARIGTTVYMFLPRSIEATAAGDIAADIAGDVAAGTTRDAHMALPHGRGEHLLVIEDDDEVRALTTTLLEGLNYRTTWCPTADAALRLIESGTGFDLVLIDVRLPGKLNGLQLADILKRRFGHVRTVIYSGYPEVGDRRHGPIEFPFLRKPFSRRELALVVASALVGPDAGAQNGDGL